jgi:Domain of unknown function (DUF4383)
MRASTIPHAGRTTAVALIVAALGVVLQILGGADYPAVPPVLFILLAPAALVAFGPWWWTPIPVFFFVIGIIGFVAAQQDFGMYHNLLHVLTGVIALAVTSVGTVRRAQVACSLLGVLYLALGVLGMALGDPAADRAWDTGLFTVSMGDHVFHSLVGVVFLAGALLTHPGGSVRPRRV